MSKSKSPAEQLFDSVLKSMRAIVPTCSKCHQTLPGVRIAPIARAVGVTPPTIESFVLRGQNVSQTTLNKLSGYVARQEAAAAASSAETA